MVEGKKPLRCFVISSDKSFCKNLLKYINRYRFGIEVIQSENLNQLENQTSYHDIIFLDEEIIHKLEKAILSEFIFSLSESQISILLFTNYKKKLPAIIIERPGIIQIVSKSLKRDMFLFHMETIEYQITNSAYEYKRKQQKYLETIIRIQNLLLTNPSSESKLTTIFELIGDVSSACRVTLFENQHDYQGKLLMTQRSEWTNIGVESQLSNPIFELLPYQPNYNRWEEVLSSGGHICDEIGDFPNSERPLLTTHGIKKLLLIPIVIKENFWGFVMLSICRNRDLWSENEISLIKSVIAPLVSFLEIKIEERKRGVSDKRLQRIFVSSNIGLILATKEGNLKSFNPAFIEMLGYSEKELKSLNYQVFTHPDDISRELKLVEKLLDGEIPSYLIEKRFIKKGGSIIWVKVNITAYSKEKGVPESLIGIVENVTREKETEQALQESEDRYHKLSDLSLEGIVLHQDGEVIDCNERFLEMFGYSQKEVTGKNLIELFADKSSLELVKSKLHSNDNHPYEATGKTKSGSKIPVELENRTVDYKNETIRVTAFRDITARKKNEQEIRKLNIAIDQSPSSIVITNKDGKIEYVNKSFSKVTGYSYDEALGNNPRILKTDYHDKAYYKDLWDAISSGKTWNGKLRNRTKSGAYYWERAVISPIFDEDKNITHYLAIKENITKKRKKPGKH